MIRELVLTEEHKELLSKMVNEWSFKEFVLEYGELDMIRNLYHKVEIGTLYSEDIAEAMNKIRSKWIAYHKGEYDNLMPEQWAKFKQHKY